MSASNTPWQLDSRLRADTLVVSEDRDLMLLLMNDRRWPWLIIVPKQPGAEEWSDLEAGLGDRVFERVQSAGDRLKDFTNCTKINIAAIGNMVRQLHIHVIARSEGDANWPGPVWGFGQAEPYDESEISDLIARLKDMMTHAPLS